MGSPELQLIMKGLLVLLLVSVVSAQRNLGNDYPVEEEFFCPEPNGFFPDPVQCDKYYECVAEVPEEKFCPDGLLFDASDPNSELCDYPFNVDCGDREFVQEPEPDLDSRCFRANGFFNHEDDNVCNKYYNCVHGYPHPYDCPPPLIFDEGQGTCVRETQASQFAKKCEKNTTKASIEGFSCPDEETLGPNGQPLAHPSFPHPVSCRLFLTCEFMTNLKEFGCQEGQVFHPDLKKCVLPEDGPDDCKCWYSCPKECPDDCNSFCACP